MYNGPMNGNENHWVEITVRIPVADRDATIGWFLDRGIEGVQEEYRELEEAGEGVTVVSGAPGEWAADYPGNPGSHTIIRAWLAPDILPRIREQALRRFSDEVVTVREIPDRNWNATWLEGWEPTPVGQRLLICPEGKHIPEVGRRIAVRIRSGMAFGTGTHFSTSACLELAEDLLEQWPADSGCRVLDVGTGSGILAIAALLLGASRAVGVDLDEAVIAEARDNAALNDLSGRFEVSLSPVDRGLGSFDLVFANLIAQVILDLAEPLASATARGGHLVLSGILRCHEDEVEQAFDRLGMSPVKALRNESWVALHFRSNHL